MNVELGSDAWKKLSAECYFQVCKVLAVTRDETPRNMPSTLFVV